MSRRRSRTPPLTPQLAAMVVHECGQVAVALWLGCLIDRVVLRVGSRGDVVISMPLGFRFPFTGPEFAWMTPQQEDAFCRLAVAAGAHVAEAMWGLEPEAAPLPDGESRDLQKIQALSALLDGDAIERARQAARRALEVEWEGMKRLVVYASTRLRRAVLADARVRRIILTERSLVNAFGR